ncbi:MAG: orotate phosphoribosyltransferase [Methylohalobius sp.]|nr:orotate phosphoribosyltransferase [Methylohalobius sp.]
MLDYQREFIEFAIKSGALRFGRFNLKSGRQSPYFFNAGSFYNGDALRRLGHFYAQALAHSRLEYDMLYGPAYKGIPLVCATAIALAELGKNVEYAFNRKEAKGYGEGGRLIGAPLKGRVVIVDDVITAGISVRESVEIITAFGALPCAVAIALDRQEIGANGRSAASEVQERYAIPVLAIVTLEDMIAYFKCSDRFQEELNAILAYRARFGA